MGEYRKTPHHQVRPQGYLNMDDAQFLSLVYTGVLRLEADSREAFLLSVKETVEEDAIRLHEMESDGKSDFSG